MLGEVGERHLARRDEGRDAGEESNGDEKTGASSMMPAHHSGHAPAGAVGPMAIRPGEQDRRAMKGKEHAEHDTEETQYRRRMRIESGIQVLCHVPTIGPGDMSLIGKRFRQAAVPIAVIAIGALADRAGIGSG